MALIRRQSKVNDKIPTSSMADIAFLLLVFFLVTTVFDEEKGLQVVLPEKGEESEVEVSPKNLLFFLVQPDGSVVIRRGESPQEQRVTHRQV
ncbi:MAG: biopolymer transporter ExbD, partial [Gemmatimonadota bacterium]|nr:biopolymer transporter ExbD [Gemmatimonadota bacterium]